MTPPTIGPTKEGLLLLDFDVGVSLIAEAVGDVDDFVESREDTDVVSSEGEVFVVDEGVGTLRDCVAERLVSDELGELVVLVVVGAARR